MAPLQLLVCNLLLLAVTNAIVHNSHAKSIVELSHLPIDHTNDQNNNQQQHQQQQRRLDKRQMPEGK